MFKKILVAGAILGTAAYLLRDKIAEGYTFLEERFLTWAAEDSTEDEAEENPNYRAWGRATVPEGTDGFPVGKRHEEE